MKDLFIFGCGGHTESLIDVIKLDSYWNVAGLIGKKEDLGRIVGNFAVNICDNDLNKNFALCEKNAIIGVGQIGLDSRRYDLFQRIKKFKFSFPKIISPSAYLSNNSVIGSGTVLFHSSFVNTNVEIGTHCIINSKSLIEHGSKIGDFCHISTGAIINGEVSIGKGSFIGSGAIIREGLKLPENTVISAGQRVMGWPLYSNEN